MLTVTIPARPAIELWDEEEQVFIEIPPLMEDHVLDLEHSLVSIAKWESKWKKAFLSKNNVITEEQSIDYIKAMTLTPNVPDEAYISIPEQVFEEITSYINESKTATVLPKMPNNNNSRETVTSELIYYWMIALNIPPEYDQWHFSRLMTLIELASIKNAPPKKMGKKGLARQYAEINAARRKQFNTRG